MQADMEELVAVEEIGEKIGESVLSFFKKEKHREMIERLRSAGIQLALKETETFVENKLQGKSFVVSGVFSNHSRHEIKALIEKYGGKNTGSISSKTNYVLAGENMGPAKKEKAEKLGIPIISEDDFEKMIH